jgi:hypothetical protein
MRTVVDPAVPAPEGARAPLNHSVMDRYGWAKA